MNMDCITFRSITLAQRAQKLLQRSGVPTALQRTPRDLEQSGCGYCLRLRPSDRQRATQILTRAGITYRGIYGTQTGEEARR